MTVTVAIPTYNSEKVIGPTLQSVLAQSAPAEEILVLDDGSTDSTISVLKTFEPRIRVLQQQNGGVAAARNALSQAARGDLVAFLDHDDLWHPDYLLQQRTAFSAFPQCVAFFTGHLNFHGFGPFSFAPSASPRTEAIEVFSPLDFLRLYNTKTGLFGSMSYCCVPKRVLDALAPEAFKVNGVDDSYLCTLLPFHGPVAFNPEPFAAYRILPHAQSANRLKAFEAWVRVFELLEQRYEAQASDLMKAAFNDAYAGRLRAFGKVLMRAGRPGDARRQFARALRLRASLSSRGKSLFLFLASRLPSGFQPHWSPVDRAAELARAQVIPQQQT
jgi:glycosyltransferase involved in cell wall biosynthesis